MRRDLEHRAEVLGESLADKVDPYLRKASHKDLQATVEWFGNREHLTGVVVYNPQGHPITPCYVFCWWKRARVIGLDRHIFNESEMARSSECLD